jgi:hypothetical protein
MNQATAARVPARPVRRGAARTAPTPPRLRAVSAPPHTRSRAGLVLISISLLGSGLVALLLLNVSLERGSYELQQQESKAHQLQDQAQALREQLAALQSPQQLAAQAEQLGMVPNPNAAFLRASDGKILGVPTQAVASRPPAVAPVSGASAGSVAKSGPKSGPKSGSASTSRTANTTGANTTGANTTGAKRNRSAPAPSR